MAVEAKNCEKFMSGHCPLKNGRKGECKFNHEVETCSWGKHCPDSGCLLRHPEACQKQTDEHEDDDRFRVLREEIEQTNLSI